MTWLREQIWIKRERRCCKFMKNLLPGKFIQLEAHYAMQR